MTTSRKSTGTLVRAIGGVAGLSAVLAIAACGSVSIGSQSAASSPAASAAATASSPAIPCKQISSLRTSLATLTHLKVNTPGSAAMAASDLGNVKTKIRRLAARSGAELSGPVSQLSAGLDTLGADVQHVAAHPSRARLARVGAALQQVRMIVDPIVTELRTACSDS